MPSERSIPAQATKVHADTCGSTRSYYHLPADAVSKGVAIWSSKVMGIADALSTMTWHGVPADVSEAADARAKARAEAPAEAGDDVHGTGVGGLALVCAVTNHSVIRHTMFTNAS